MGPGTFQRIFIRASDTTLHCINSRPQFNYASPYSSEHRFNLLVHDVFVFVRVYLSYVSLCRYLRVSLSLCLKAKRSRIDR